MPETALSTACVLVVEDEAYVRESLRELLAARGYDVQLAPSAESALTCLAHAPVDVVLTDLRLPGAGGEELVEQIRAAHPGVPVVVLTGHGNVRSAVRCIKLGAEDYILKPADPDVLAVTLERALTRRSLQRELSHLRGREEAAGRADRPIGESEAWRLVLRQLAAAARSDSTVLLLGESGTGKELLARRLHALSPRSDRAFVRVNCSAVPLDLWESEFFGHRRGAFTGATSDREGRFRLADRGTLFMDEIGTMPLAAQAKVLRVLENGEFDRLGEVRPTRVDVRVVAATNSDLAADVDAGRFRSDLFYRLNVVPIRVPPLRERVSDIPLLVAHFLVDIAARLNRAPPTLAGALLADLKAYPWPGNVRELRNVLERALILHPGDALTSLDLLPVEGLARRTLPAEAGDGLDLRSRLHAAERELVTEALRRAGGVRKEASRLLGIDPRNLPYYLRKHEIDPERL